VRNEDLVARSGGPSGRLWSHLSEVSISSPTILAPIRLASHLADRKVTLSGVTNTFLKPIASSIPRTSFGPLEARVIQHGGPVLALFLLRYANQHFEEAHARGEFDSS